MTASFRSSVPPKFGADSSSTWSRWIRLAILGWIAIPVVLAVRVFCDSQSGRGFDQPRGPEDTPRMARLVGHQPAAHSSLRTQSCSTSNCHGSLTADIRDDVIRADEYFVWLDDPHARAHRTLFGERSRAIFQRLGVTDDQLRPLEGRAERFHGVWANCLACHETNSHLLMLSEKTVLPAETAIHPALPTAEGVSCESCHGDARDWLHRHSSSDRADWKALGHDGQRDLGYISGSNVAAHAQRCATCHVGSSGGDVNHDLIAAGHPALRFEYVWYLSRLPMHWKPGRRAAIERRLGQQAGQDRAMRSADPTRDWLIGQLVTAIAALEQLERRVGDAAPHGSWPEFAEYNCSACHHELNGNSWRLDRGIPGLAAVGPARSHLAVPWGNWNLELIPIMADQFGSPSSQDVSTAFGRLRDAFRGRPVPADSDVISRSKAAREKLETWLTEVSKSSDGDAARMLQQLGRSHPERLVASWDQTATVLLGFAALHRSAQNIPEPLQTAMNWVRLPDGPIVIDSPRDFRSGRDPQSLTSAQWVELLKQLANLAPEQ